MNLPPPAEPAQTGPSPPAVVPIPVPSAWRRFLGWFLGCYAVLYYLPFPFSDLEGLLLQVWSAIAWTGAKVGLLSGDPVAGLTGEWAHAKQALLVWLVPKVFGIELTAFPRGSGDTTYNYLEVLAYAVTAACVALPAMLLGRWLHWPRAGVVVRTLARYYLAGNMLGYGFHKAFPLQFGTFGVDDSIAVYGQSTPMNLLWTFLSFSAPYTMFGGITEAISGVFLLFRRTTTLGALVGIGVMSNVVMLNFCYDVPVKLFSSHLLLMCVYFCLPDARALWSFLVVRRPAEPTARWVPSDGRRRRRLIWVESLLAAYAVVMAAVPNFSMWLERNGPEKPLQGLWRVETFTKDGQDVAAFTSPERWRRLIFTEYGQAIVQRTDDQRRYYKASVDEAKQTLRLESFAPPGKEPPPAVELTFTRSQETATPPPNPATANNPLAEILSVAGTFEGTVLEVKLKQVTRDQVRLLARGFHWINEGVPQGN